MRLLESNFSIFYNMVNKVTDFKAIVDVISTINTNSIKLLFFLMFVLLET